MLVGQITEPGFEADGLDWFSWAMLADYFSAKTAEHFAGKYEKILKLLYSRIAVFFESGKGEGIISYLLKSLRQRAYRGGADRELLLADVVRTVCRKKLEVSSWNALPEFTGLGRDIWKPFIQKPDSIKELWPAQLLLGQHGTFKGRSAVVQMPTSAGKTRATELIIRSAFLSGRTKLAIIVAPYRALCHEIYDGLAKQFHGEEVSLQLASDVLQEDLSGLDDPRPGILILTPEKLDYLLRQQPKLADATGLIVYDEGHLFDDSTRGVKYELLLASLKRKFTPEVQVVLISAVIGNAKEISHWLTGEDTNCVIGRDLHPTYRTVAFASWVEQLGQLYFVETENTDQISFFVPRILETQKLAARGHETAVRLFPNRTNSGQIALYLACKLIHNGAVAIFVGRKDSAGKMAEDIVDAFQRELQLPEPSNFCDAEELEKLVAMYERNLGDDCTQTNAARIGVFLHHSTTPHGIRLAVEHALQNSLVRFVICTSTLAQGVNLPLRYLIVTTDRQGKEKIRIRDFHNLMGRAGRAGMYTEGTILFANPAIFDKKLNYQERWRWADAKNLLNPEQSEACRSFILSLLDPLVCRDAGYNRISFKVGPVKLAKLFYENRPAFDDLADQYSAKVPSDAKLRTENKGTLLQQLRDRGNAFQSISAFLVQFMSEAEENGADPMEAADELLSYSLAFHQATENQRTILQELFSYLQERILTLEPSPERRKVFAKTVFDIPEGQELMQFATNIVPQIDPGMDLSDLLGLFWPVIYKFNTNPPIRTCSDEESLKSAAIAWLNGDSFGNILPLFDNVRFGRRNATIDHIVEVCENGFGYQGSMVIGACIDLLDADEVGDSDVKQQLRRFQKALKYGLPSELAVAAYEIGMSERSLAIEISQFIPIIPSRRAIIASLKKRIWELDKIVDLFFVFQF